jgi:hypothetical protein
MARKIWLVIAALCLLAGVFLLGHVTRFSSPLLNQPPEPVKPVGISPSPVVKASPRAEPSSPTPSGHTYHVLDLLQKRPFPDQGKLVLLNVVSQPTLLYENVVSYMTLHRNIPEAANVRGVRFKGMLNPRLCLYDVIEALPGDGVEEPTAVGQIVVEIGPNVTPPGNENNWEVEPEGFQEVTTTEGTVLHLPKVRFWSYE